MNSKLIVFLLFIPLCSVFGQYNTNTLHEKAKTDLVNKEYEEAKRKFNILIQINPSDAESYFYRGLCKYYLGDNEGAAQDFSKTIEYNPSYWNAYYYRALVYDQLGKYREAVVDYNRMIENDGNPQVFLDRAISKLHISDFLGAIEDCNTVSAKMPVNETVYICRGMAEASLAKFDLALNDFKKAISINPKSINGYLQRGIAEGMMQDFEKASADYTKAIQLDSTCVAAYYSRAIASHQKGDFKGAMKDYGTVLKFEPLNALAYYNRAVLKSNLGDINDAIKDFDKVLQINPQNLNAVFNRAKLKQSRNDFQGALKDYNKTLDLYPHFLEAYFNRSILKKAMGDIVGANQDYSMGKHISDMNHKANPDHVQQDAIAIEPLLKLSATFEKLDANALKSIDNNALLPLIVIGIKDTTRNNFPEYSSLLATLSAGGQPSYSFKMEAETHIPKDGVSLKKINTNKQTDTLLRMAVRELNDKENASAILHSTEAITKKPNNEIAFFIRALAELSEAKHPEKEKVALQFKEDVSQKYKKALLDFNNTIHLEPTFAFAYYNRAFVKCKLLDLEGAISDYNMAIQMNEGVAAFYFNKALVHFYLKENSQACQALSKAGELGLANAYPLIKLYCH